MRHVRILFAFSVTLLAAGLDAAQVDVERRFRVSEAMPRGERVGWIAGNASAAPHDDRQTYFIVFPDPNSEAEKLLDVNERTGEIVLRSQLDYEKEKELRVLVMPVEVGPSPATGGGGGVKVIIEIVDENDNPPHFPTDQITLEISELARLNTELALPPASDADSGVYTTQRYRIIAGNANNMFRVSSHHFNGVLYVDLILNGRLDREYRQHYDLVVEALDGGDPPRSAQLAIHIVVLDANDNAPEFAQQRYAASIPRNAEPDFPVIRISARDADAGENARITYRIIADEVHDVETLRYFEIDADSGLVTVADGRFTDANLAPSTVLTVIVSAVDHGQPSALESTTSLTVTVTDRSPNKPIAEDDGGMGPLPPMLDVVWLTDGGAPAIREDARVGHIFARIALEGVDQHSRLTLTGSSEALCLRETENADIYLLLVCGVLDRERHATHRLSLLLRSAADGGVTLDQPIQLDLVDINDNAPTWNQTEFRINWTRGLQSSARGLNDVRLSAADADEGENAHIRYTVHGTTVFGIHPELGVLFATDKLNCATESPVQFRVIAEDNGWPRLSSSADVLVELVDAGPTAPLFQQSYYEATVSEDAEPGTCFLQVSAEDRTCTKAKPDGVSYSIRSAATNGTPPLFHVDEYTGRICVATPLDFEKTDHHELVLIAKGIAGKSSSVSVIVLVENVDDNAPEFYAGGSLALRVDFTGHPLVARSDWQAALVVVAYDADDLAPLRDPNNNGSSVVYSLQYDERLDVKTLVEFFRLDSTSGRLYVREPLAVPRFTADLPKRFQLQVLATDARGLACRTPANINVELLENTECGVAFGRRIYEFTVAEDLMPGIAVGYVDLLSSADLQSENQRESNYSLRIVDIASPFAFDENTWGKLVLQQELDAETQKMFLLTVEARHKTSLCRNYTQVKVTIEDVNDNAPIFAAASVELSLAEDFQIHRPFFTVHATDRDSQENGRIIYELLDSEPLAPVVVDAVSGQLRLTAPLDRERVARYRLRVRAHDAGVPARYATTVITVNVADINDNPPLFDNPVYHIEAMESTAVIRRALATLHATDRDSGINGKFAYHIIEPEAEEWFGIDATSGELYAHHPLDRETRDAYAFTVAATDAGTPQLATNASVRVRVLDANDHTPTCNGGDSSGWRALAIAEDHELRDALGWTRAMDADQGANAALTYRLQLPHPLFDVRPKGDVYLKKRLPSGLGCPDAYVLPVLVEDGGVEPRATLCRLTVYRSGGNFSDDASASAMAAAASEVVLHEPLQRVVFLNASIRAEGTELAQINASNVAQWQLEDNGASEFAIITGNGSLRLRPGVDPARLFRGGASVRPLTIAAVDVHGRARYVTLTLRSTVAHAAIDAATSEQPRLRLTADLLSGTRLINVASRSSGAGGVNSAYYQLSDVPPGAEGVFELDELTGDLYVNDAWALRRALRSRTDELELRVVARPLGASVGGSAPNRTTLVFDVSAHESARTPRFSALLYRWNVSESVEIGAIVGRVEMADVATERSHAFRYQIAGELGALSLAGRYFRMDPETGDLLLQRQLDYSAVPMHIVIVEAVEKDAAEPEIGHRRAVVVVEVMDENNHAPEFLSQPNCALFEESPELHSTSPIHHFVARDRDSGTFGRVTYELMDGNKDELFELEPHSGALMVRNWTAAYARRFPVRLRVRAWDGGSSDGERRFAEQHFVINADASFWAPLRRAPVAGAAYFPSAAYEFTMTSDAPPNTVVHNFWRSDFPTDEAPNVTFRVFPRTDAAFVIGKRDGVLKTAYPLSRSSYSVTVFAFLHYANGGQRVDRTMVHVRIVNAAAARHRPRIAPASCADVAVPENVAVKNLAQIFAHIDGSVADVTTNGTDGGALHFKIEGGSWGGRLLFAVDEHSGIVSCVELDREAKDEHLLVISVSDESVPKKVDVCTLRVRVLDDNDNVPQFDADATPDTFVIDDQTTINATVAHITARDSDVGTNSRLRYRLSTDRSRMLDIDVDTGALIFARELAFAGSEWMITVSVEDCGTSRVLAAERQLRVLWRRRPLAPTTLAELALRGRPAPRFLRRVYAGVVAENQPARQFITRVETDWPRSPAGGAPLIYRIVSGNADGVFDVDPNGGIFTVRPLDAEAPVGAHRRLTVIAAGRAAERWIPVPETHVDVHVLSLNDNPPMLAPLPRLIFAEDLAVGSLVTTVSATDADFNSVLEFTLNPISEHFAIGRYTGAIVLTRPLDCEQAAELLVGVQNVVLKVYDGEFITRANLSIGVLDLNDNAPRFDDVGDSSENVDNKNGKNSDTFVEIEVADGGWAGAVLRRFRAIDRDAGRNGTVRYVLAAADRSTSIRPYFAVNETTGDLQLLRRLADGAQHFLEMRACDGGAPPLCTMLTIRVVSVRRDAGGHNGPVFFTSIVQLSLNEAHPPYLPFANTNEWLRTQNDSRTPDRPRACRFRIVSADATDGAKKSDEPERTSDELPFAVNPSTGELFPVIALDREHVAEWRFRVAVAPRYCAGVSGNGSAEESSTPIAEVIITVGDANDNAPVFADEDTWNVTTLSSGVVPGTILARLAAHDVDALENGTVVHELLAGDRRGVLRLNVTSGALSLDHWDDGLVDEALLSLADVDGPARPSLALVVGARDAGTPPHVAYADDIAVPLDLRDWPGGAPVFAASAAASALRKFALESTAVGTRLFNAAAISRLPAAYRRHWVYRIEQNLPSTDTASLLSINETTADVFLARPLDFETLAGSTGQDSPAAIPVEFRVYVEDRLGGTDAHASVALQLFVVGVDEFAPVFSRLSYTFKVPFDAEAGAWLGAVDAMDRDAGADGRVRYEWRADSGGGATNVGGNGGASGRSLAKYFRLNASTGEIHLRRPLPPSRLQQPRVQMGELSTDGDGVDKTAPLPPVVVRLTVAASSGTAAQELSTKAVVYFEIMREPPDSALGLRQQFWHVISSLSATTLGLMAAFFALLLCLAALLARLCCCQDLLQDPAKAQAIAVAEKKTALPTPPRTAATVAKRRIVYSVANRARLPVSSEYQSQGPATFGAAAPSTALDQLRLPPPPQPPHSLLSDASTVSRGGVSADFFAAVVASGGGGCGGGPLSQPDSGIDPDVVSVGSGSLAAPGEFFASDGAIFRFDAPPSTAANGRTAQILSTHNFRPYQKPHRQTMTSQDRRGPYLPVETPIRTGVFADGGFSSVFDKSGTRRR